MIFFIPQITFNISRLTDDAPRQYIKGTLYTGVSLDFDSHLQGTLDEKIKFLEGGWIKIVEPNSIHALIHAVLFNDK